jgi:hypothetical protein
MSDLKIQGEVSLDTSNADAALTKVTIGASKMADSVSKAGKTAGDGMSKIGDGGDASAAKVDRATSNMIGSIQRATAAMEAGSKTGSKYYETLAGQRGISTDALKPYLTQLDAVRRSQELAAASAEAMQKAAAGLGIGVGIAISGFGAIVKKTIDAADSMNDLSKSTGIAVEQLAGLNLAAQQAGGDLDGIAKSINKLSVGIGKDGERFRQLGIDATDPLEAFKQLSDVFKSIDDPQTRAALGAAALGKAWESAAPLLSEGGDAIGEMVAKGTALSGITKQLALDSDAFNDALAEISTSMSGQVAGATSALLPLMQELANTFNDTSSAASRSPESFSPLVETLRALTLVGGNVAFVFKAVGTEIGGIAAQAAAFASGDFKGALSIGGSMKEDAEAARASFDAWEQRIVRVGTAAAATEKAISKAMTARELDNQLAAKSEQGARAKAFIGTESVAGVAAASATLKDQSTAYDTLVKSIHEKVAASQLELMGYSQLSESQKETIKLNELVAIAKKKGVALNIDEAKAQIALLNANEQINAANTFYLAQAKDRSAASAQLVKSAQDEASRQEDLARNFGLSKSAIEDLEIARLQEQLTQKGGIEACTEETYALELLIEAKKRSAKALAGFSLSQENADGMAKARKELDAFLDPTKAQSFGDALTGSLKEAGGALQKMSVGLQEYGRAEAEITKARQNAEANKLSDPVRYAKDLSAINEKAARSQIQNYAQITGAAKGFFSEGTKGYKALEAAENTFRAIQLASDLVKGVSAAAVGIAGQAQGDPYTALPRMAIMAAAMAGLGFAVGGFGGGDSGGGALAADVQKSQGTGSAFGDAAAKSDSIAKSITEMSKSSGQLLPVNQGMLSALKNIESSMAGFTNLVVRDQGVINGGNLGVQEGQLSKSSVSWNTALLTSGIFAPITKAVANLWGKTTQNIADSGVSFGGKVSDLQSGKGFNQYASVNTTESSWFGLKKSTSNSVQQQALSAELSGQFGLIFSSMGKALSSADEALGGATGRVEASLKSLTISATQVSLKGLSGNALTEALNSVISKSLDEMASYAFPQFDKFREVGEGYAQTVLRVANTFSSVNESFDQINLKLFKVGDSGISAALGFSKLIGGIEELSSVSAGYYKNFFSEAEQSANTMKKIAGEFAKQGLGAVPKTRDDYRALVENTSKFGTAEQLASILKMSDAFAQMTPAIDKAAEAAKAESAIAAAAATRLNERRSLQEKLDSLTISSAEALARQRAAIDDSNKSLFDQVQAATSAKAAQDALAASTAAMAQKMESAMTGLANSRSSLEVQLLAAQGNQSGADALSRKNDLAGLTTGMSKEDAAKIAASYDYNLALTAQIKALQDAKVAAEAAAQAQAQAAQAATQAAEQMQSAWQSLTDSIVSEVQRLRGLINGDSSQSASALEAQFASATAGARAGDQEAAKLLPEISRALEQMYSANAQTLQELNFNRAVLAASLEKTAQGNVKYGIKLPSYDVGTDYVSRDQVALIHEGEGIIPKAYNASNANNTSLLLGEVQMLNARIVQLLSINAKTEEHSRQSADILDRVSGGGGAFLTELAT